MANFELVTHELFGGIYGAGARYNAADHVWRLPNGGYVELGQLESMADYGKYQGHSCSPLLCDEAGQYATPNLLDLLRSNLRAPAGIPMRIVMAANPGGPGHAWLAKCYVFRAAPWQPFFDDRTKTTCLYAPSTYEGNPFIDRAQYRHQPQAACANDPELLKAWLTGDWTALVGSYFSTSLDEHRNAVAPWRIIPTARDPETGRVEPWDHWLAHDFGSSAPSVTYIVAKSPGAEQGGVFYPRDSLILVDELAAVRRDSLNDGLGWTAAITAEAIREMCGRRGIQTEGIADNAIFARNTGHSSGAIADEFARAGLKFRPAKKADRVTGWQMMRRLLQDAGKPDVPGLYISRDCSYWWATVPYLARDQKRPEDVDSCGQDHAADATSYGLLRQREIATIEHLTF